MFVKNNIQKSIYIVNILIQHTLRTGSFLLYQIA